MKTKYRMDKVWLKTTCRKNLEGGDNFSAQVCKKKGGGGLSALILMGEQFCLTISREFLDMHVYVEKPTCIHV